MGVQSAAVRVLGVAGLSSTFFTGTLTDTVRELAGPGRPRWTRGASGVVALVTGAAAEGAVLACGQPRLGPLLPVVLVAAVAALGLRRPRAAGAAGGADGGAGGAAGSAGGAGVSREG
jgi:uncharacterized membrane protein YoaK (UPF0700 family)